MLREFELQSVRIDVIRGLPIDARIVEELLEMAEENEQLRDEIIDLEETVAEHEENSSHEDDLQDEVDKLEDKLGTVESTLDDTVLQLERYQRIGHRFTYENGVWSCSFKSENDVFEDAIRATFSRDISRLSPEAQNAIVDAAMGIDVPELPESVKDEIRIWAFAEETEDERAAN